MFKTIIHSFKKSKRLKKISKVLGHAATLDHSELIKYLGTDTSYQDEQALDDLFDLCESDPYVSVVMQNHDADKDKLRKGYRELIRAGAGQWAKGHYVPVSSLVYPLTLDYLLRNLDKDKDDFLYVAHRLLTYFQKGEIGKIDD